MLEVRRKGRDNAEKFGVPADSAQENNTRGDAL